MEFRDIKPSNRLQIEYESGEPSLQIYRGIVLARGEKSIILVSDYGELVEIYEDKILSISSITMSKLISDAMIELRNHYSEIYELELKLKELRSKELQLKQSLVDANLLSKFNISGAKNRLDKSIDQALLCFEKDELSYRIYFESNPNNQIEVIIQVSNHIDYPQLDEVRDVEKIVRVHAPNIRDLLVKCFPFSKPQEIEKKVIHEEGSIYSVRSIYQINVDVTKDSFLDIRELIKKGLKKLRK
ncbi:hypothetical protein NDS46_31195 (plasmid) [Paenibacillus thiaminolyticus]|uniref:hypothetical protein n=1 Tax=Paenibacillus thiaminolyticus TaxID=49283 RepID=UPI00232FEA20|nr:hypothetical protein [Paenibacillus thiaminolyticus]WCF11425.1 hypothetical protein NDS46_31195 [Paenibacillus thiaminolyticus]